MVLNLQARQWNYVKLSKNWGSMMHNHFKVNVCYLGTSYLCKQATTSNWTAMSLTVWCGSEGCVKK